MSAIRRCPACSTPLESGPEYADHVNTCKFRLSEADELRAELHRRKGLIDALGRRAADLEAEVSRLKLERDAKHDDTALRDALKLAKEDVSLLLLQRDGASRMADRLAEALGNQLKYVNLTVKDAYDLSTLVRLNAIRSPEYLYLLLPLDFEINRIRRAVIKGRSALEAEANV